MGDPRPHPGVALPGVMEQPGDEDLGVGDALGAQRRHDIEPVTAIGDVHLVVQLQLCGGQPVDQSGPLVRGHAGPDVRPELADLSGPPGGRRVH